MDASKGHDSISLCAISIVLQGIAACTSHHPPARASSSGLSDEFTIGGIIRPIAMNDCEGRDATKDPLGLLRNAVVHYGKTIRDYRCRFLMRVTKNNRLGEQQEIAVKFRERPYSVEMNWIHNPDGASRVTYVAGRWRDSGKDAAMIYPAGILSVMAPLGVKLDIRSPLVMRGRSHGIDEFGYEHTLIEIVRTCERLKGQPDYSLEVLGTATLEGRACYVLRRLRPRPDPDGRDGERMLLIYLDRNWLVPIGCFEFSDDQGSRLLASFVTADVEFNVGLTDADF
jgi:hypothetical protein